MTTYKSLPEFLEYIRAAGFHPPEDIEPGTLIVLDRDDLAFNNSFDTCYVSENGRNFTITKYSVNFMITQRTFMRNHHNNYMAQLENNPYEEMESDAHVIPYLKTDRSATNEEAKKIWHNAGPAPNDHPYLASKMIHVNSSRLYKGLLVLPVINIKGELTNLHFFDSNGIGWLLTEDVEDGCYIHVSGDISSFSDISRIIICIGWATGCTLATQNPTALVLAAINVDNLEPVALAAEQRWSSVEMVIASDDIQASTDNHVVRKAWGAAVAANALLDLPQWPHDAPKTLINFNDLDVWQKGKHGDIAK